jgi:hypothetical protein
MKKCTLILATFLLFLSVFHTLPVLAASASATLTGPGTVRAGDTITLTFNLNGSNIYGASGVLSYDSDQLTFTGSKQLISSPWEVEFNGKNMVAYDNKLSSPINKSKKLFSVSFKVKSVEPGTRIAVSFKDVKASDGSADAKIGTVSYSVTIAAPLSSDNNLAGLTVSNATITPSFSPGTTSYTAKVPFSISKLDISATASDSKAKVGINNPTLTPDGTTKVTVTVTAENGEKKTYTIKVTRDRDPNYVPSGNNKLSSITVEGFLLSPVFSPDITDYVVWLPYETESVVTSARADDDKAKVKITGGDNLVAGQDNIVMVTCIAENGEQKDYTVVVKRAAAHGASADPTREPVETAQPTEEPTAPPTEQPVEKPTEEQTGEPTVKPADLSDNPSANKSDGIGVALWLTVLIAALCAAAGFVGGYMFKRSYKRL